MPKAGLFAAQYRDRVISVIMRVGIERAMKHLPLGIMYSGPWDRVYKKLKDNYSGYAFPDNNARSETMASQMGGTRINDMPVGKWLGKKDLDPYFDAVYLPIMGKPGKIKDLRQAAYTTVWGGVSQLFAALPFRQVATAICGASRSKVFRRYELKTLVANPYIEVFNTIDMNALRQMHEEVHPDEAYNLTCLTELSLCFRRATREVVSPAAAWQDFVDRLHFYNTERKLAVTSGTAMTLTPAQESIKQEIIRTFGLEQFYAVPPERWGGAAVVGAKAASCVLRSA